MVIGKARAKQAFLLRDDPNAGRGHVLPLLMHGDAAFAGQGVIAECFALMGLKGYRAGGTIHFIVNNQIGFTTSPRYSQVQSVPVGFGADGRGADLPRQRRRPGSRRLRRQGRHRVSPAVRQGRGDRHVLLSPLRAQRRRRSDHDPALDVRQDQGPSVHARALRRAAGERGRRHQGRGRPLARRARRLPRPRVRGRQDLPRRQGRLAGRQVGAHGHRRRGRAPRQDRRAAAEASRHWHEAHRAARAARRAQDRAQGDRASARRHRRGRGHRLGDRRTARLRQPARRDLSGPALGPG